MSGKTIMLGPLPPPYGGVGIFTQALFEFVKGSGVRLWFYRGGDTQEEGASRFKPRSLALLTLLIRNGYKARIVDSSHFLVEHPHPLMVPMWLILKWLLRFTWVKVVHDGSLPGRYDSMGFVRRFHCKLAVRSVDEFAVVNDHIAAWLRDQMKVTIKVSTVNALLPLTNNGPAAAIETKGFSNHTKTVCSTGVFTENYGFSHVADCIERIRRDTGEDIGLVLIDGTFVCDPSYREAVVRNRDWITVLENVPHPHVLEIFRRCDAFVRGFRYEGYGLSRIEAIWCGIPVIAARGEESRGMLLYDFGDLDTLHALLVKVLFTPPTTEIERWAGVFQGEAELNLERWKSILNVA